MKETILNTALTIAATLILILFYSNAAFAGPVKIAWDASTEPELSGYNIYYSNTSQANKNNTDKDYGEPKCSVPLADLPDADNPVATIELSPGTHFIAITCFAANNPAIESTYSNELEAVVRLKPVTNLRRVIDAIISFFNSWRKGLREAEV